MSLNVKKGDTVIVIAGKDKGKTGKVLSSNPAKFTVKVEGVNEITKHVKPRSAQQQGGIVKETGSINASNVMLLCPVCNKGVRFSVKTEIVDGKEVKVRICKKCGATLEYKVEEVKECIRNFAKFYINNLEHIDYEHDECWNDLHMLFGASCALAELQIALPGEFETDYPLKSVLDRRPFI